MTIGTMSAWEYHPPQSAIFRCSNCGKLYHWILAHPSPSEMFIGRISIICECGLGHWRTLGKGLRRHFMRRPENHGRFFSTIEDLIRFMDKHAKGVSKHANPKNSD